MGIETVGMMLGGMLLSQAMAPSAPSIPAPPTPAPPPQTSQAPSVQGVQGAMAGTGQAGGAPGVAETMLTGAGGIDPNLLKLGKSTLLGS